MDDFKDSIEHTINNCRKELVEFLNELKTGKNEHGQNISRLILDDLGFVVKKYITPKGEICWVVKDLDEK